jgi:hypothetical protein
VYVEDGIRDTVAEIYSILAKLLYNRISLCVKVASFILEIKVRNPCTTTANYWQDPHDWSVGEPGAIYDNSECSGLYAANYFKLPQSPDFRYNDGAYFEQYQLGELELIT